MRSHGEHGERPRPAHPGRTASGLCRPRHFSLPVLPTRGSEQVQAPTAITQELAMTTRSRILP